MSTAEKRLVVLISGSGSNLQAFIDQCANGTLNARIVKVLSNKVDAFGLTRAANAGIDTCVIDHTQFESRAAFDAAMGDAIETCQPDAVILAGFMRILTPEFVSRFHGRLLNIHPSLLPKYPGLHTHQRAIDAGDRYAGASVHFVTAELDGGPVVLQAQVAISGDDTAASLAEKILIKEHIIYPRATQWLLEGRLALHEDGAYLDKQKLEQSGILLEHDH